MSGYAILFDVIPKHVWSSKPGTCALEVHMYTPLVKVQCSPHLKEFLCAAYVPMCSPTMRTPCRELCQSARAGCENLMVDFGFEWPGKLACESFPSSQEDMDCYIGSLQDDSAQTSETCQPLRVPSCSHMPYNYTEMQNTTQEQIETLMQNYLPLIQLGCSSALTNFFCSIHAPPVSVNGMPSFPCREMCEAAIDGCPILQQAPADQSVDCNLFPPRSSGMCVYVETEMDQPSGAECEPLELTTCQGFGYTHTAFPNYLAQQSQSEAAFFANIFDSIENTGECADVFSSCCQLLAPRCVGEPIGGYHLVGNYVRELVLPVQASL
ncbi:Frizzled-1 [Apostichopus japonicus]|uniref:Frizzled-1 n=1 Tax=Stichopus japonicus TaxID=307972 RepID=A0A2G8JTQ9_STIJA|nr:Frizzled-1 [Apostichopus japonicus]